MYKYPMLSSLAGLESRETSGREIVILSYSERKRRKSFFTACRIYKINSAEALLRSEAMQIEGKSQRDNLNGICIVFVSLVDIH